MEVQCVVGMVGTQILKIHISCTLQRAGTHFISHIFRDSILYIKYLLPTCSTMSIFVINYRCYMFRPQFLAYVVTYA